MPLASRQGGSQLGGSLDSVLGGQYGANRLCIQALLAKRH